jgi:cell division protein FtsB
MKDAKNVLRVVGMILLGLFVLVVAVPFLLTLVFNAVGITVTIISFLISLAVLLIKVAVVLAIGYLVLIGVRALLR